jgi:hypothetical protein
MITAQKSQRSRSALIPPEAALAPALAVHDPVSGQQPGAERAADEGQH